MTGLITKIFGYCQDKRWLSVLLLLAMFSAIGAGISQLRFEDDLNKFIPDNGLNLREDLRLIQQLPAQSQVLISLYKENPEVETSLLVSVAKDLSNKLISPYFSSVLSKQIEEKAFNPVSLRDLLPNLFDDQLAISITEKTTQKAVNQKLRAEQQQLFGMGAFTKSLTIREDPLELYKEVLPKLKNINSLGNIRLSHGLFMNEKEDSVLIIATTPVKTTDSTGSEALTKNLNELFASLPEGIKADAIASQIYAAANSTTIKSDIFKVSIIGIVGLILIAFFFLRSMNILPILLAPVIAYGAGAAAIGFVWQPTLAMIFGFAPILLGISIDYALHLYYVYAEDCGDKKKTLSQVTKPILISAFSTILAFSLLLFSSVSGLKQLSFFIVVGLLATLCYTLLILPHFLSKTTKRKSSFPFSAIYEKAIYNLKGKYKSPAIIVIIIGLSLSVFMASKTTFQSHIREMGIRPNNLVAAEARINSIWGKKSESVMIFSMGNTINEALENAYKCQTFMAEKGFQPSLSILEILPPISKQNANQENWAKFLEENSGNLQQSISEAGNNLGFSQDAFNPFYKFLEEKPGYISYESITKLGLGSLLSQLYFTTNKDNKPKHIVVSIYPEEANEILQVANNKFTAYQSKIVSMDDMGKNLGTGLSNSFANFIILAIAAMAILLLLMLRKVWSTIYALLPALIGLVIMAASLSIMQISLGIFALAGALLVIGHGVDYGVYINHYQQNKSKGTPTAILVSGLTSLVGFGALITAEHPALHDMGISVFSGVLAAMITALFVVPLLMQRCEDNDA